MGIARELLMLHVLWEEQGSQNVESDGSEYPENEPRPGPMRLPRGVYIPDLILVAG